MPVGIGYDVHRFGPGRRLVLCGVEFDDTEGLVGHSDADVAAHAIMDALLGAAALGDIGQHFPPSDAQYSAADSLELLRQVARMLDERGWIPGNIDVTIIAERPRLSPRVGDMKARVGAAVGLDSSRVGVKATTNEGLGFLGRGEGIAALAVAEVLPRLSEGSRTLSSVGRANRE